MPHTCFFFDLCGSGQTACLLNGGNGTVESASGAWGQTIGKDKYPVLRGPAVYKVTYYANGGTGTMDAQYLNSGQALAALASTANGHVPVDLGWGAGKYPMQLAGRTLYKDGAWNTLCLPFDVTVSGSVLDGNGVVARTLTAASISGTTLNLTFGDPMATIEAGRPYIIKWDAAPTNIVSPVFSGVTVSSTMQPYDTDAANSESDPDNNVQTEERVRFLGTYKSTTFDTEDKSILFLGAQNMLYYPQPIGDNHPRIGAQRAYFKIGDDASNARMLTAFNFNFGDEQTGIKSIDDLRFDAGAWYDMSGRRLSDKPTKSGVYVNGGRKVVIK